MLKKRCHIKKEHSLSHLCTNRSILTNQLFALRVQMLHFIFVTALVTPLHFAIALVSIYFLMIHLFSSLASFLP